MPALPLTALIIPLSIVAVSVPLILQKVPRNRFYGFRTPFTMSSNEIWYYSNKISGIAMLFAGLFWLLLNLTLPALMRNSRAALALGALLGAASIMAALAVSYYLARRKFPL